MVVKLWRIEKGLGPDSDTNATDYVSTPTMCPEFYASCVSANAKGAERMGIVQWWQSYGIKHRAKHCKKRSRCGIHSAEKANQKPGCVHKCNHCNAVKWTQICPCLDCDAERKVAAEAFRRTEQQQQQQQRQSPPNDTGVVGMGNTE